MLWLCLVKSNMSFCEANFLLNDTRMPTKSSIIFNGGEDVNLIFVRERAKEELELVFGVEAVEYSGIDHPPMSCGSVVLKDFRFTDNYRPKEPTRFEGLKLPQYPDKAKLAISFADYITEINVWGLSYKGTIYNIFDDPDDDRETYEVDLYLESFLTFHFEKTNMVLLVLGPNIWLLPDSVPMAFRADEWNIYNEILKTLRP